MLHRDGRGRRKRRCHGADGNDLIVKVPEGTVIKDFETGKVIADMSGDNQQESHLKRRQGRTWKYAFCNFYHAGAQVCPAGTAGARSCGVQSGAEGHC
ncbi:MAG: hypothetical protein ACLTW9_06055 [Enterocloster sp.]